MIWVVLGVAVLAFLAFRAKKMGPLFADAHLAEIAALLPELKRQALAGQAAPPASFRTSVLGVAYTITRHEGVWVHHLSVSNPVTPARAAGTFFLGLVRGLLGLEAYPQEAFVSQNHVFHLVAHLSDDEQRAFAETLVEPRDPGALRAVALAGRGALLPRLEERAVALPTGD
jgi:hypothetical protein